MAKRGGHTGAPAARALVVALGLVGMIPAGCGSSPPAPTADQVVSQLATKVPNAKPGPVVTAANDSNRLLGRPGQYTSAAAFSDDRVPVDQRKPDPTSLDNGGKVEAFATADDAQRRAGYIEQLAKATPVAVEYDYVAGTTLVRVSKALTPDEAAQYQAALG